MFRWTGNVRSSQEMIKSEYFSFRRRLLTKLGWEGSMTDGENRVSLKLTGV